MQLNSHSTRRIKQSKQTFVALFAGLSTLALLAPPPGLAADPGQYLTADKKAISMQTAKTNKKAFLVTGSRNAVTVPTKLGSVICAPYSTAYVFENDSGITVFNFEAKHNNDVRIMLGKKALPLRVAEEIAVSQNGNATFNDINPKLGIIFQKPHKIDSTPGFTAYAAEFSLLSGVKSISRLRSMVNSSKADERNTIKQILQNAAILQSSAERVLNAHPQRRGMVATTPQLDEATQAKIAALSAIKPRMPGNILQGNVELFTGNKVKVVDISLDTARASHYATMPGLCWLQFNNDDWTYKTGADGQTDEIAGFITCSENTVLKTQLGIIDCKAGARVFIVERKDSEAICTLDSGNLSDVKVKIGDQFARRIPPGREILLSKDFVNPIEDTALTHQIGVRALREVARLQGTRIAEQDFSVPSAILALPPLREKLESKNPADKKMVDSLLNNAVILTNLTSAAGAYQETK